MMGKVGLCESVVQSEQPQFLNQNLQSFKQYCSLETIHITSILIKIQLKTIIICTVLKPTKDVSVNINLFISLPTHHCRPLWQQTLTEPLGKLQDSHPVCEVWDYISVQIDLKTVNV